ncbi:hypothetical protein C4D60_Mb06t18670 [Musa balbisiana]|uniref:Guanosine nucleotide diphosphate dissociation inhibitor n=1 Tax=Musa balbisiana TaxID=52838 RepID=A0A4S8IP60_MUSBA|nr:hypothetical protein C4D60_Mb06t18670 [Musa balbisiana]
MDEEYDVIVLGTGLKECILSGLLSVDGLKLWKRFRGSDKPPAHLGPSRDYNVDMIPKFMMANGTLVRTLIHTDVTKYLSFKAVDGSYVFNKGKIHKVPATDMEALKSPLMGLFEKRRARKFFIYVQNYDESDPKTHEGLDLTRVTTKEFISKYGLDDNTVDFIGHALALHRDDRYLNEPALDTDTVKRIKRPLFEGFAAANLCFFNTINISCQFNLTGLPIYYVHGRLTNSVRMDLVLDMVRDTKRIHVDEAGGQVRSGQVRSGQVRSGQVRSGQVRSGQVRSGQVRSGQVRSGQVRSGQVRSGQVRSGQVRSGQVRSGQVRSGQVRSGQVRSGQVRSGQVRSGQVRSGQVRSGQVRSGQVRSGQVRSGQVRSGQVRSGQVRSGQVRSGQVRSGQVRSGQVRSGQVRSGQVRSGQVRSGQVRSGQVRSGQVRSGQVRSGQVRSGQVRSGQVRSGQVRSGQVRSGQVRSGQVRSGQVRSGQVRSGQVRSGQVRSGQVRSGQVRSGQVRSGQVRSGQVRSGQVRSGQVRSGQVRSGQVRSGQVRSGQVRSGQVRSGQVRSGQVRSGQVRKYGLDDNTVDFIGHALALHRDDRYLNEPALDTVKRIKLYEESLARFQGGSPYIYPLYGLGELPQAFARLSAVYGGTYMLNKLECKVKFDMEGKACGVTSEGETARCKKVVCDPSYLPNKVRKVGKVARAIAIMSHPIPNTDESHSAQVILPQKQLGRKSDMYLFCCSYSHNVAPKGKFIAFVSAEAETDRPEVELKPGIDLLGPVDELFFETYDIYEPVNEPSLDNCFISTSYDATSHFESTVMDVLSMYTMITGKTLDLSVDLSAASAAEE